MCESFYILHVNKCGFLVCRTADAKTIPTSISQLDKLKLSHPICTTSAICIILVHHAHLHSWCITSAIAIIPIQHAHIHSLCISSAMDKLFQAMCNIPNQHALLIQPKCTIPDQHALLIQPKCTIPVHHAQHCHTFSTTLV